jgi:hypothetical protein
MNILGEIFPGHLVSLRGRCGVACTVTGFENFLFLSFGISEGKGV